MAEWLRRLTRNQMGSSRVGSNPTRSEKNTFNENMFFVTCALDITKFQVFVRGL